MDVVDQTCNPGPHQNAVKHETLDKYKSMICNKAARNAAHSYTNPLIAYQKPTIAPIFAMRFVRQRTVLSVSVDFNRIKIFVDKGCPVLPLMYPDLHT